MFRIKQETNCNMTEKKWSVKSAFKTKQTTSVVACTMEFPTTYANYWAINRQNMQIAESLTAKICK